MASILVLQIEDRENDEFLNNNMQLNKIICQDNNMQYKFMYKSKEDVPPYWGKVFEIDRILNNPNNSSIDYIFWLDSDAFFLNFDRNKLDNFLNSYSNYSMIITKDPPPWTANFNAGSFIVKNDKYGREIVSYWKTLYNPNNWWRENNTWKTNSKYAGDDYEQGALATKILTNNKYSEHIKIVPYYILNNTSCTENVNETIVSHLAGNHKNNIITVENCKKSQNASYNKKYIFVIIFIVISVLIFVYNKKIKKYYFQVIKPFIKKLTNNMFKIK
jgi:hypothetical protein